ncbi:MAG: DUF4167 domain-containing protein [Alphaproteobacteria bacterium]|nr:DUF4167 domain-containing protein [Alphaproteobacteria bacterium]
MRQNNRFRHRGYHNNNNNNTSTRSIPQTIYRNTVMDSSGPLGKLRGTALQLCEKYQAAAKDAQLQNDITLSETCAQFADHYSRLQNTAIANEQQYRSYQIRPAPAAETPAEAEADGAAVVETPEESSEEDRQLRAMDLSVPITAIQKNHTADKPRRPQHRREHPKADDTPAVIPEAS